MVRLLLWVAGVAVVLALLDRLLLWAESRGWINYRRNGLHRGAATYHLLELSAIFSPRMQEVIAVKYGQQQEEDESGDPPVPDPADAETTVPEDGQSSGDAEDPAIGSQSG